MNAVWEYKVTTLKYRGRWFSLGQTAQDDRLTATLNRQGAVGWELVKAVGAGALQPVTLFLKRPR